MTLLELQVVFQAISSLAIAGGLIFTGVQFRAVRRAQYVANFTKLVDMQMQLRRMRVDHPELARVHPTDIEQLASNEEIQHYFLNLMQASIFEIVWFSYRNGQLPADYFRSWEARMKLISRESTFSKAMQKSSTKFFHDDFQRYLEDLSRSSGAA